MVDALNGLVILVNGTVGYDCNDLSLSAEKYGLR